MSSQAFEQFNQLQIELAGRQNSDLQDSWTYSWKVLNYSSMKMYKSLIGPSKTHHIFRTLWKCSSRPRHKFFLWLLLHDRVNTRNLLHRKSMHLDSYNCVLCSENVEETLSHLCWDCTFALSCWNHILPNRNRGISSFDEICLRMQALHSDIALEIIQMSCWSIWSVRNDKIFQQAPAHLNGWIFHLSEGMKSVEIRAKPIKAQRIKDWTEQFLQ